MYSPVTTSSNAATPSSGATILANPYLNNISDLSHNQITLSAAVSSGNQQIVMLVAKFEYKSKDEQELDLRKNEKLILLDNSKNWWLVQKCETNQIGFVPSNYVKKEKKSILEKIIQRKSKRTATPTPTALSPAAPQPQAVYLSSQSKENSSELIANTHNSSGLSNTTSNSNNSFTQSSSNNLIAAPSKAIVKHKYVAKKSDELTLSVGTHVLILNKYEDGWCKIESNGMQGLYPSNYLDELGAETSHQNSSTSSSASSTASSASSSSSSTCTSISTKNNYIEHGTSNLMNTFISTCKINDDSPAGEIEYVKVIYAHEAHTDNHLTVRINELLKLVDESANGDMLNANGDQLDLTDDCYDEFSSPWLRVMNCRGSTGLIPSNCVQPVINSNFVFIRKPAERGLFANRPWYYGNISRYEANVLLNKFGSNGDFLLRDSERDAGNYSISLKSDNINNKHFKITYKDNNLLIGKKLFNTMEELIENYKKHPIFDQNSEKLYLVKALETP